MRFENFFEKVKINFNVVWLKTFLIDFIALVFAFVLMLIVKLKVESLLVLLQNYDFSSFSESLSYVQLLEIEQQMRGFSGILYLVYFLMIVVLPLGLYLFFSFSQGINFSFLLRKRIRWGNVFRSVLFGVPFFVLGLFFLFGVFNILLVNFDGWVSLILIIVYFILGILFFYLLMCYWVLIGKGVFKGFVMLKNCFKIKLLGLFLGMFLSLIVLVFSVLFFVIKLATDSLFGYSWIYLFIISIVFLWVYGFFRKNFVLVLKKFISDE